MAFSLWLQHHTMHSAHKSSHADFGAATHPGVGGGTHHRRATFERCEVFVGGVGLGGWGVVLVVCVCVDVGGVVLCRRVCVCDLLIFFTQELPSNDSIYIYVYIYIYAFIYIYLYLYVPYRYIYTYILLPSGGVFSGSLIEGLFEGEVKYICVSICTCTLIYVSLYTYVYIYI